MNSEIDNQTPEALMRRALAVLAATTQEPTTSLTEQATGLIRRRRRRNLGLGLAALAVAALPAQLAWGALTDTRHGPDAPTAAAGVGSTVDSRCHQLFRHPQVPEPRLASSAVIVDVLKCTQHVQTVNGKQWWVAQENHSRGSLLPFTKALKAPDYKPAPGEVIGCTMQAVSHTNVWVKTSDGEWIQPHWPQGRCLTSVKDSDLPTFVVSAEQPVKQVPATPAEKK